jgi:signal transduction histidine kinase/DNA-binding response OmpR family regulator
MEHEKTKILIVDDLPEKILVYRVILEELGQELVVATSGAEALKCVLQHDFAVILLDVNMPGMDGFETAALIRSRKRSAFTPIIFVTAFTDELRVTQGYAQGAVDYILAPVVPEILRAKVKVFVDLFRMTEQVKRQAAEQIALAEERTKRTDAEEANRRLSLLAQAGVVLGQSLDQRVTAHDVARLAVPELADLALIAEPGRSGGPWNVIQAAHREEGVALDEFIGLDQMPQHWAAATERTFAAGRPETLPSGAGLAGGTNPDVLVLPLKVHGRTFAVLVLSREPSGRGFLAADRTVSEALASRGAIAIDNARLYHDIQQADQQKNEFLSMLAHELRNPLAPIRNAVAVLQLNKDGGSHVDWARDVIDRQVRHLVRLVDDLLDVSRITQGKIRLEFESLDVAFIVQNAVETSRPLIESGGHELSVELPPQPLLVRGDRARIAQVLANLLNNAAKYTAEGGQIAISARREDDEAVFRVRDSGVGIAPEMIDRVFDLFTQVDCSLARSQGGLGIGLTLVRRLVELHGGTVSAASAGPGQGSEFTVRLPALEPVVIAPQTGDESQGPAAPAAGLRVLVVDDNADAADSLAQLLRISGHQVKVAYDGLAAVDAATSFQPQAAVLDLGLPGLDGYELACRLRDDFVEDELLLIALSGYGRSEDVRRAAESGFQQHFVKPVDLTALLKLLATRAPQNGLALTQVN